MITLNHNAPETLYQQLVAQFKTRILNGELKPGARLPASRVLARELNISRISVMTAFATLENEGLIASRDRRGWFVVDKPAMVHARWLLNDGDLATADVQETAGSQEYPTHINLSSGNLPTEFMPVEAMRQALNKVLDRDTGAALGYEPTEGFEPLRRAIATQLFSLGMTVDPQQVLVTGGCQQAIDLAVQSLVPQNGVLLTTDPTYIGLIDIARTRRLELVTVPWTTNGIDANFVEQIILERKPHLLYLMTTFQNPTGAVLPLVQRRRLLALAARYNLPILEDGVYDGLAYDGSPLPSLHSLDEAGLVLYVSGFSKTVVPGTRIGYLISREPFHQRISQVKQSADICTPGLNQRAMAELLGSGQLGDHLEKVRRACRQRRNALLDALSHFAGGQWHWTVPTGGLFVWVELPNSRPTVADVLSKAAELGIDFAPGTNFSPAGSWPYHMRLNFTSYSPRILVEAVRRLWTAWISS